ncbi:MAG TPA: TIGR03621 family F420-dependent LLM class oxidoreductase [Ilumatobacteraceae bacterium]|nr:TIGR03621 family F420-dependent LLM class oxidoreductase [Ilumatobacteraceae bacterium]
MVIPHERPFRFGVQLGGPADAARWVEQARRIEDLGYSTVTMPDHFTDQLAPLPALSVAAAATTTLRIGALVFDNDYKHPAVLAKELATQDVLSGGRVEIGLGAGWMETDYRATGIAFDPPGVRIDRFVEGIAVIKGAMADGPFSFHGRHYTITDYDAAPKPVQRPHPPLLIGGGGRRVLSIAAREADIVGINGNLAEGSIGPDAIASMTRAAVTEKVDIIRAAAGDRFADLELNIRAFRVCVTDDAAGEIRGIAGLLQVDDALVAESPFALIGTTSTIADLLRQRRAELGVSYVIVGGEDIDAFAPVVAALAGT